MAGYREFQTGEVLTAANVDDFLAKQAVMKFADAAARDSALGTAVAGGNALREGMVAYLDDEDLPSFYNGTSWSRIGNAGIGSNVVQTVKTDVFSTASASFTDVTGLAVTITPASTDSEVLLLWSINVSNTNTALGTHIALTDGSNNVLVRGDADGSRNRATAGARAFASGFLANYSGTFLWSPSSATAVTAKLRILATGATSIVNRISNDDDTASAPRVVSTITAIEVAA